MAKTSVPSSRRVNARHSVSHRSHRKLELFADVTRSTCDSSPVPGYSIPGSVISLVPGPHALFAYGSSLPHLRLPRTLCTTGHLGVFAHIRVSRPFEIFCRPLRHHLTLKHMRLVHEHTFSTPRSCLREARDTASSKPCAPKKNLSPERTWHKLPHCGPGWTFIGPSLLASPRSIHGKSQGRVAFSLTNLTLTRRGRRIVRPHL